MNVNKYCLIKATGTFSIILNSGGADISMLHNLYALSAHFCIACYYTNDLSNFALCKSATNIGRGSTLIFVFKDTYLSSIEDLLKGLGFIYQAGEGFSEHKNLINIFSSVHTSIQLELREESRCGIASIGQPYFEVLNERVEFIKVNIDLYASLYESATALLQNKGVRSAVKLDATYVATLLAYDFLRCFSLAEEGFGLARRSSLIYRLLECLDIYKNLSLFQCSVYESLIYKLLIQLEISLLIVPWAAKKKDGKKFKSVLYLSLRSQIRGSWTNHMISTKPYKLCRLGGILYNVGCSWDNIMRVYKVRPENSIISIPESGIINANSVGMSLREDMVQAVVYVLKKNLIGFVDLVPSLKAGFCCKNISKYEAELSQARLYATKSLLRLRRYKKKSDNSLKKSWDMAYDERLQIDMAALPNRWLSEGLAIAASKSIKSLLGRCRKALDICNKISLILWIQAKRCTLYLPHTSDFRGRIYPIGPLSTTHTKEFRCLLQPIISQEVGRAPASQSLMWLYMERTLNIKLDEAGYYKRLINIELNKLFLKKTLGREKYTLSLAELASDFDKKSKNILELGSEDLLYYLNLMRGYRRLLLNNLMPEHDLIFMKDATASGLQNFGLVLGYKPASYKALNLVGGSWTDVY